VARDKRPEGLSHVGTARTRGGSDRRNARQSAQVQDVAVDRRVGGWESEGRAMRVLA
jgi:hypothetical protein